MVTNIHRVRLEHSSDKDERNSRSIFGKVCLKCSYQQYSYPPGRTIDIAQSIGYNFLDMRYYNFAMKSGGWYYKDRLGRTREPMELITMKTAWATGIIDTHTFV